MPTQNVCTVMILGLTFFAMAAIGGGVWLCRRDAGQHDLDAVRLDPAAQGGTTVVSSERRRAEAMTSKAADEGAAVEATDSVNSQVDRTASTARSAGVNLNSEANSKGTPAEMDGLSVPEGAPFPSRNRSRWNARAARVQTGIALSCGRR
jgi:hypothetical protein